MNIQKQSLTETSDAQLRDIAYHIVTCIGLFAKRHHLTRQEACRYMTTFKGIDFIVRNYDVEHQLSFDDCIDDMELICKRNGGMIA